MSQANFCHHCAARLVVGAKFCSSCGVSLASLSNKPEPPSAPTKTIAKHTTFAPFVPGRDEDDDDENRYDHMEHLDIQIDGLEIDLGIKPLQNETLGGIVQAGVAFGPGTVENRDAMPKMSKKKFMSEWAKEAGSIKK